MVLSLTNLEDKYNCSIELNMQLKVVAVNRMSGEVFVEVPCDGLFLEPAFDKDGKYMYMVPRRQENG